MILFQVCSKIIHVLQGESVEQKAAPFLLEHFKHFGSPVMIGKVMISTKYLNRL